MTVTYSAKVATVNFACFLKLLIRWRGSIYKLVWREFLLFSVIYYAISIIYRFTLNTAQRKVFENMVLYCEEYNNRIPVAFVLGFYVAIVVQRWWEQFNKVPWPDRMALFVMANVHGHDERARLMRRTIMRYLCLAYVITLSSISSAVKKRFPTFSHMTSAGFMLPAEEKIIAGVRTPHNKYFIPLVWCTSLVTRARKEGRIRDDFGVKTLIDEINNYRGSLGTLFNYDWINVPLVYTQVVTLAVYSFFLSCLMGRQFVIPEDTDHKKVDIYIPVFTFLQFLFYMGWLKVAEVLVNPFGEDDEDFDINWVIDRNLQVSYLVVDEMHQEHPHLIKDAYWDEIDFELPYTVASRESQGTAPHIGSAININLPERAANFLPLSSICEEEEPQTADIEQARRAKDIPKSRFHRRHDPPGPHAHDSPADEVGMKTEATRSRFGSILNRLRRSTSLLPKMNEESESSLATTTDQRGTMQDDNIFEMDDISYGLGEPLVCKAGDIGPTGTGMIYREDLVLEILRQPSTTSSRSRQGVLAGEDDRPLLSRSGGHSSDSPRSQKTVVGSDSNASNKSLAASTGVASPPADVTSPPVDVTSPPADVTSPPCDVPLCSTDVTSAPIGVITPPHSVASPGASVTSPVSAARPL